VGGGFTVFALNENGRFQVIETDHGKTRVEDLGDGPCAWQDYDCDNVPNWADPDWTDGPGQDGTGDPACNNPWNIFH
jgi:hypothetical protein